MAQHDDQKYTDVRQSEYWKEQLWHKREESSLLFFCVSCYFGGLTKEAKNKNMFFFKENQRFLLGGKWSNSFWYEMNMDFKVNFGCSIPIFEFRM